MDAGTHEVVLTYQEPTYVGVARWVSALAAAVLVVLTVVNPRWRMLADEVEHAA
jgi:hypothetical protein